MLGLWPPKRSKHFDATRASATRMSMQSWRDAWQHVIPFLALPPVLEPPPRCLQNERDRGAAVRSARCRDRCDPSSRSSRYGHCRHRRAARARARRQDARSVQPAAPAPPAAWSAAATSSSRPTICSEIRAPSSNSSITHPADLVNQAQRRRLRSSPPGDARNMVSSALTAEKGW